MGPNLPSYTLEKESIKNGINQSRHGKGLTSDGYLEIVSKVKLRNSSDKPLTLDVTVAFIDSENDKLGETTGTCRIEPGESKKSVQSDSYRFKHGKQN